MDQYDEIIEKDQHYYTPVIELASLCRQKDAEIARLKARIADIHAAWDKFNKKWEEANVPKV